MLTTQNRPGLTKSPTGIGCFVSAMPDPPPCRQDITRQVLLHCSGERLLEPAKVVQVHIEVIVSVVAIAAGTESAAGA